MKLLLLLLVLCAGCFELGCLPPHNEPSVKLNDRDFQYYKDASTGLCFAVYAINSANPAFVCVPCDSLKRIKSIAK